jgi:hypothetical protein
MKFLLKLCFIILSCLIFIDTRAFIFKEGSITLDIPTYNDKELVKIVCYEFQQTIDRSAIQFSYNFGDSECNIDVRGKRNLAGNNGCSFTITEKTDYFNFEHLLDKIIVQESYEQPEAVESKKKQIMESILNCPLMLNALTFNEGMLIYTNDKVGHKLINEPMKVYSNNELSTFTFNMHTKGYKNEGISIIMNFYAMVNSKKFTVNKDTDLTRLGIFMESLVPSNSGRNYVINVNGKYNREGIPSFIEKARIIFPPRKRKLFKK